MSATPTPNHFLTQNIMEEWKDIEGYEGLYQVSNEGRVKSLDHIIVCYNGKGMATKKQIGKILKPIYRFGKYQTVTLTKNGIQKLYLVHRLVAKAFIPNPSNLPHINHKDENPSNNFISNLEWCTHKYNMNYGTCQQRKSEKMKGKKISSQALLATIKAKEKKVYQYTLDGKLVCVYNSLREASRLNNISASNLSCVCNGKQKTANGYIWAFN